MFLLFASLVGCSGPAAPSVPPVQIALALGEDDAELAGCVLNDGELACFGDPPLPSVVGPDSLLAGSTRRLNYSTWMCATDADGCVVCNDHDQERALPAQPCGMRTLDTQFHSVATDGHSVWVVSEFDGTLSAPVSRAAPGVTAASKSCTLTDVGTLTCENFDGDLIQMDDGVTSFVATGARDVLYLTEDGALRSGNHQGAPLVEERSFQGVQQVAGASSQACVLHDDGAVACTQDLEMLTELDPEWVDVPLASPARAVHVSRLFGCALLDDDTLTCWDVPELTTEVFPYDVPLLPRPFPSSR